MTRQKHVSKRSLAAPAPTTIQASLFKATCLELMDDLAARHGEIVVTKHGRPVVKVGPVDPTPPSPVGFLRNTVIGQADLISPDHDAWHGASSDPLDARKR